MSIFRRIRIVDTYILATIMYISPMYRYTIIYSRESIGLFTFSCHVRRSWSLTVHARKKQRVKLNDNDNNNNNNNKINHNKKPVHQLNYWRIKCAPSRFNVCQKIVPNKNKWCKYLFHIIMQMYRLLLHYVWSMRNQEKSITNNHTL
jgi:hypothetical protein